MFWVKRLLPIAAIIAGIFAYRWYQAEESAEVTLREQKYALLTARAWVASTIYRKEPEKYLLCRDSILQSAQVNKDSLWHFLESYQQEPEKLGKMANMIKNYVDSLVAIEDSLRQGVIPPKMDATSDTAEVLK